MSFRDASEASGPGIHTPQRWGYGFRARAFGMPTTLLIDPHGCEIGTIAGPAEWSSKDAIKLIEAALGGAQQSAR